MPTEKQLKYWASMKGKKLSEEHKKIAIKNLQYRILTFNGFNVYRFWEHEINISSEKCIDKILV